MNLNRRLLQETYEVITKDKNVFLDIFYNMFLTDYPALRPYFERTDMEKQKREFSRAFTFVIRNLEHGERLKAFLRSLGATHGTFGIKGVHYTWFSMSVMKAIQAILGPAFDAAVKAEWEKLLHEIEHLMMEGAVGVQPQRVTPVGAPTEAPLTPRVRDTSHMEGTTEALEKKILKKIEEQPPEEFHAPEEVMVTVEKVLSGWQITLPESCRTAIRQRVQAAIDEALRKEIQTTVDDEMARIDTGRIDEYLRKVS